MSKKYVLVNAVFILVAVLLFIMAITTKTLDNFFLFQSLLFVVVGISNLLYFFIALSDKLKKRAITFFLIAIASFLIAITFLYL